ncbi:MAG TPA: glycosyltransferase [Tepidisphaeraceae bacterium]|nr:glycosyltransferase [Tepidisphaeraceae bacterium]
MRIVMFYHSLVSDWNHGNAHFLRGIVGELLFRGHDVRVFEPKDGWSIQSLRQEHGSAPLRQFRRAYPALKSTPYEAKTINLKKALAGADLVIVHEWSDHDLVRRIGEHRQTSGGYRLLFHDTHHRAVTDPQSMAAYDLSHFDGVLAYGNTLKDLYLKRGWTRRAWTWHEAADTRLFRPIASEPCEGDLVWVGNWGDDERTAELHEFLLEPVKALGLKARVYGVRYPVHAIRALADAGIEYAGWLPNFEAPRIFARFKVTVHVPRRPYVQALPGIPTIRVFEALACGIPLVCSPWPDSENLFRPGFDYAVAQDGTQMRHQLRRLVDDAEAARVQAAHGHNIILSRHTCAHRVDQLLNIVAEMNAPESDARDPQPESGSRQPELAFSN